MSLLSSCYVAHALDKRGQEKVILIFLRLHLLNKYWKVSSGKINLYINESILQKVLFQSVRGVQITLCRHTLI